MMQILALLLVEAYSFSASIFIFMPVMENELNIKSLLVASKVQWPVYWLGTFLFDYIAFCIPFSLFIIFGIIFEVGSLTSNIYMIIIILLNFGVNLCFKFNL